MKAMALAVAGHGGLLYCLSSAGAVSAALAAGAAMVETVQMVQVSKDGQPERISMRALL